MRRVPPGAPILSAGAMRGAEAAAFAGGLSQCELMKRAGLGVAREVHRYAQGRPVLILAGPGNNGGDGYVAARFLSDWGHDVIVASLGESGDGAAADARRDWKGRVVPMAEAPARAVLVDALFATGFARALNEAVVAHLRRLSDAAAFRIAVDIPSGLDADGCAPIGHTACADLTAALGALKPAHLLGKGAACSGHVTLVDLGIEVPCDWTTLAKPASLRPDSEVHKFTRGLALIVGGAMPGAGRLAATAALRGGAGYVVLASVDPHVGSFDAIVSKKVDEADDLKALLSERTVDALCIGPGLGRDDRGQHLLDAALASQVRLIVDGDALTLMGEAAAMRVSQRDSPTILTPHGGEFTRMFGASGTSKIQTSLDAARGSGAIIVHKGPDTVIANPDGRVIVSAAAPATLATAGSGDVLAGLIAGRLATGGDPWAAVTQAAWLHLRAAELAGPGLVADDLIAHSAAAMQEVW